MNTSNICQTYPLNAEELDTFGWVEERSPIPFVLATRTPDGKRLIPTRQVIAGGAFFYGFIETYEPPSHMTEEDWDTDFTLDAQLDPSRPV